MPLVCPSEGITMRTIRQTALIRGATPHDIYVTLMNGKRHGALAGQPTKVSPRVGGAWNVGHDLEGKHVALVKGKKIVQTWRANNWPAGVYSKATFALAKAPGGTRITSAPEAVRKGTLDREATRRGRGIATLPVLCVS